MDSDVVLTTYAIVVRDKETLQSVPWRRVVLDEAQYIKNPPTKQTAAIRSIATQSRIALTGTPVENRLAELWSILEFCCPGYLGTNQDFRRRFAAPIERNRDQKTAERLRSLVRPFILRRLKTDLTVISDLPPLVESRQHIVLTDEQMRLYEEVVADMLQKVDQTDGIRRRGLVLSALVKLKQICNHPDHWAGGGGYEPEASGKFLRLAALAEEIASRQEKVIVISQFREITQPLADYLQGLFGRPGLVLHGGTPVPQRRKMVEDFQREEGPPFFVLSLKAGGTGLTLTAASHVIHFDRWWNPAIENQATDRAFRIGQKRNVLVHKFVCRGTIEERIDELITRKKSLAESLLGADGGAESLLTEMSNSELLNFVSLDIRTAMAE